MTAPGDPRNVNCHMSHQGEDLAVSVAHLWAINRSIGKRLREELNAAICEG